MGWLGAFDCLWFGSEHLIAHDPSSYQDDQRIQEEQTVGTSEKWCWTGIGTYLPCHGIVRDYHLHGPLDA